ncbi:MAG: hypothetical protein GVY18_16030 [Bacteroidetes bacterium]|jgi:hypothetical protein|nr:hypothetical protein [Bacteroidota bacterium]
MRLVLATLVLLIASAVLPGAGRGQEVQESAKLRFGDDLRWAQPDWNDDNWIDHSLYPPPDTQAVFWMRTDVEVDTRAHPLERKALYVSVLAASEVYWDGVQIGRNGRVGSDRTSERPGPIDALFLIPDSLYTPGVHTLALRLSTFHLPPSIDRYLYGLVIGDYQAMMAARSQATLLPLFFLGGFFIIALYYGVLYVLDRRRPALLLFSLLCFSVSALLIVESWRWTLGYTYDWHLTRLLLVAGLTALIGVLLPLFFMVQFRFPHRRLVLAVLIGLLGLSWLGPGYDGTSYFMFWSMLGVSAGITGWAALRRKKGAVLALTGVLVCVLTLLAVGFQFMDTYFFPAFSVLIVCLLASLGLQMREQRRQHEQALLNAARLEIELLKKHLQPHFLLNTLTSAMAWLEEHPRTGARFIEALAEELQMLADISDKPLIPMAQELALCRTHLELMGYRRDVRFHLTTEDVCEDALVPPALFHTLIENGITHNAYAAESVTFRLYEERTNGIRRYTFVTPLEEPPPPAPAEGTGLRYVKARLEESFSGRWSLTAGPRADVWQTIIEIPA